MKQHDLPKLTLRPLIDAAVLGTGAFSVALALSGSAAAQVQFSINNSSQSVGALDTFGNPMSQGDLLEPAGGMPTPGPVGAPRIGRDAVTDMLLMAGAEEVDALSYGNDFIIQGPGMMPACRVWFSVNRGALSHVPVPAMDPTIWSENSVAGQEEAAADVYADRGLIGMVPAAPLAIAGGPARHIGLLDGDGLASAFGGSSFPGLGLIEPSPIGMAGGDNLDALDSSHDTMLPTSIVYFSLGNGSALAYGFNGADVLRTTPGGPAIYASANALGLDQAGDGTDELDALVLWDNGNGQYNPWQELFGWGQNADMLLFSVTANSMVIGRPDSIFGQPIQAGDILVPPGPGQTWPGILIAAERLGLRTLRAGYPDMDNLDAADVVAKPLFDCDGNQVEDACQLSVGQLPDVDQNGIADPCDNAQPGPAFYCTAKTSSNGCVSVVTTTDPVVQPVSGANDYSAVATTVKGFANGILFFGVNGRAAIPFAAGTLCMNPPLGRTPIQNAAGSSPLSCDGKFSQVINDAGATNVNLDRGPGTSNWLQAWYRDPMNGPGQDGSALTDAVEVTYQ